MSIENEHHGLLPPAPGASPRPDIQDIQTEGFAAFEVNSRQAQDLKMIHWYKLANEAAMKAALVKYKRFKEVPR